MVVLKKILFVLKIPGIVIGSLVTLYGVFSYFDGLSDDVSDIKETQVEYRATADTILFIARTYDTRITENKKSIKYNAGQNEVLTNSYMDYLKDDESLTKDEFVEYMNPFLEYIKKNSSPEQQSNQILPAGPDYVRESETGSMRSSQLPSIRLTKK